MLAQLACKHQHGLHAAGLASFLSRTQRMHLLLSTCPLLIRLLLVPVQAHNDTCNVLYHTIHVNFSVVVVLQSYTISRIHCAWHDSCAADQHRHILACCY